ncbi:MAG: helix-turn-helix domain-containing protein [Thermoplasmataceae archaeon]
MNIEEKIAGEIAISDNPGDTMKKWREEFQVSKVDIARAMEISPSMISDYESGRRKSPGISNIKKFVLSLTGIDRSRGGTILRRYNSGVPYEALIDISDYDHDVHLSRMVKAIDGEVHSSRGIDRYVHGYTVVDGIKAILSFSYSEYSLLYGWSSQRAIFFTDVKLGRSPMIAIRVHPLKPAAVVYIQADRVDELAIKIAEIENIPLITTEMPVKEVCRVVSQLR